MGDAVDNVKRIVAVVNHAENIHFDYLLASVRYSRVGKFLLHFIHPLLLYFVVSLFYHKISDCGNIAEKTVFSNEKQSFFFVFW